jgi:hypothetical protein
MRLHVAALAVLGVILGSALVQAHPGHDHGPGLRVWRDADGFFEMEASLVQARGELVLLCKHDGTTVWLPLAKLSQVDRDWVRARVETIQVLNGDPVDSRTSGAWNQPVLVGIFALFGLVALALGSRFVRRRVVLLPCIAVVVAASAGLVAGGKSEKDPPAIQKHFEPFKDKLGLRFDDDYFYVESNGLPDHPMMIGIRAWQQQVPLPQPYIGRNAWQIPLHPRFADKPVSAKKALFRGAIALAVNGVPIFNPIKNDGRTDTYLAGELDEYGGHCGRGDDYHYHMAPVHLDKIVGKGRPIAYALDGFPIYGYTDADGNEPKDLDEFNGRMEKDGYRYYATKTYPYVNGGMRGVVTVRDDQIEPQPRDAPVRPAGKPLRGATITDFTRDDDTKTNTLTYSLQGKTHRWRYTINKDGTYVFVFIDGNGKETTETYRRRERPEKKGKGPPPGEEDAPPEDGPARDGPLSQAGTLSTGTLVLGVLLVVLWRPVRSVLRGRG